MAGERRVTFLTNNVTPANNGQNKARPKAVFELLKKSNTPTIAIMTMPKARRRPE